MVKTDGKGKSSVKVLNSLIAGSMAGMVAKTIVAPVDRIKIMYQASTKPFTYKKGWKTAENIYKHQGESSRVVGLPPPTLIPPPLSCRLESTVARQHSFVGASGSLLCHSVHSA